MDDCCTHWEEVWVNPDDDHEYAVVLNVNDDGKRNANLNDVANDVHTKDRVLSFPQQSS
jgi:hypothetical protein